MHNDSEDVDDLATRCEALTEATLKNLSNFERIVQDLKSIRSNLHKQISSSFQKVDNFTQTELFSIPDPVFDCLPNFNSESSPQKMRRASVGLSSVKSEVLSLKKVVSHLIERIVRKTQDTQNKIIKVQSTRLKSQGVPERRSESIVQNNGNSGESGKFLTFPGQSLGLYITNVRVPQSKTRTRGQQETLMPFLSNSVINWTGSLRSFPRSQ